MRALHEPWRQCFLAGSRAHPAIQWDLAGFAEACLASGAEGPPSANAEDDFVRLATLAGRPGAIEAFDRTYLQPLRPRLMRIGQSTELVDTVLQDLRCKLLLPPERRLCRYRPSGSFRAWLAVVATRICLDALREVKRRHVREDELVDHLHQAALGPEDSACGREFRSLLRECLTAAFRQLPAAERHALRYHLVAGWNIDQIGRTLGVHRATAARLLKRARAHLTQGLRGELSSRKGSALLHTREIWERLPSQLDVSLSRVFATTHAGDREWAGQDGA